MLRLISTLLASVALLAVPATAVADKPSKGKDKDAAHDARAFADAALQAAPAIEAASAQLAAIGDPVSCPVDVPDARRAEIDELAGKLATARLIASFTRDAGPAVRRMTHALDAVETRDRVLRRGRNAWHDVRSDYARFAAHPDRSVCRQVRAYVDNGFRHTWGTRRGVRAYRAMTRWDTSSIDRRVKAAVERLEQLGVPADEAAAFAGGL
jgi:hypothetical protein